MDKSPSKRNTKHKKKSNVEQESESHESSENENDEQEQEKPKVFSINEFIHFIIHLHSNIKYENN